jgi:4-carboxymuconolactone decarboxylase
LKEVESAIWDLTLAMTANATLPDNIRQIAILVVGARFDAAYEIYAHIAVAEREGMKPKRLSTLVADLEPNDLTPDESLAFDVAYKLVRGGTLPEPLLPVGCRDVRAARNQRTHLSRWPLLPRINDAQRI